MRLNGQGLVLGVAENISKKNGTVYKSAQIYIQGKDSGAIDLSISSPETESIVKQMVGKMCDFVVNIRSYMGVPRLEIVGLTLSK